LFRNASVVRVSMHCRTIKNDNAFAGVRKVTIKL
jgi:hypothetical protein